jgi:hypothetical protein
MQQGLVTGVWSERVRTWLPPIACRQDSGAFVDASVLFIERSRVLMQLEPIAERRNC